MSWVIKPGGALKGEITVPGDKSVTQRAYIFASMAKGTTRIVSPLRSEDADNTLNAVRTLGPIVDDRTEEVSITGEGVQGFTEPGNVIDLGNSGTGARLMAGLLSACPFLSVLTGDESLRRRPMARVAEPLRLLGAAIDGRADGTLLPLSIRGGRLKGINYTSPVASAQVKSCVLIAALCAEGTTVFTEPALSRDHTERMLAGMGIKIHAEGKALTVEGGQVPEAAVIRVPGDISSAAFFLAAGTVLEGSDIVVRNAGVNPTRTGVIRLLEAMGAEISVVQHDVVGEPVADIRVQGTGELKGISIPEEWVPSIIDELPLAAVLAAAADGTTELRGAGELRVKESDRITTTVQMLSRAGVNVEELNDGFRVHGKAHVSGSVHESHGDHRIAMSSAILSLLADDESEVRNTACVATSFPDFITLMNGLLPGSMSETPEK
jgi:3-phosphoshikimate 1-carboxyvinyltransferase